MTKPILLGLDLEAYSSFLQKVLSETHRFEDFEGPMEDLEQRWVSGDVVALMTDYGPVLPMNERRLQRIRAHFPKLPIVVLTYYPAVPKIVKKYSCACSYIGYSRQGEWEKSIIRLIERAQRLVA